MLKYVSSSSAYDDAHDRWQRTASVGQFLCDISTKYHESTGFNDNQSTTAVGELISFILLACFTFSILVISRQFVHFRWSQCVSIWCHVLLSTWKSKELLNVCQNPIFPYLKKGNRELKTRWFFRFRPRSSNSSCHCWMWRAWYFQ